MSEYSKIKLHNFGRLVKKEHLSKKWEAILLMDTFDEFILKHEIYPSELDIIERGFNGLLLEEKSVATIPFGVHKDKSIEKVPTDYFVWLLKQDWIEKWPLICSYAKQRVEERESKSVPAKEAIEILELLKQKL